LPLGGAILSEAVFFSFAILGSLLLVDFRGEVQRIYVLVTRVDLQTSGIEHGGHGGHRGAVFVIPNRACCGEESLLIRMRLGFIEHIVRRDLSVKNRTTFAIRRLLGMAMNLERP
jgi:hypothetical protein